MVTSICPGRPVEGPGGASGVIAELDDATLSRLIGNLRCSFAFLLQLAMASVSMWRPADNEAGRDLGTTPFLIYRQPNLVIGTQFATGPSAKSRLLTACAVGIGACIVAAVTQYHLHGVGGDFLWLWRAAKIVLDGGDPYQLIRPYGDADFTAGIFFYPLPGVGFALPFVAFSPRFASVLFVGVSAALLAFAVTRDGFERLPLFLSAPFFVMCRLAQTTGLTMALALIPAAAGLTVMKPNIGLCLFLYRPQLKTVVYGSALLIGSVIVAPEWPREWLHVIATTPNHYAVVTKAGGAVVLLALLAWREPAGRLLLAMAMIPHALYFYDDLPLWLIAKTRREALTLTYCSWAALAGWLLTSYNSAGGAFDFRDMAAWSVWLLYVPALAIVLKHRWADRDDKATLVRL